MSLPSQQIRYAAKGDANNPEALFDFIKPSRNITGSGAPAADLGQNEWLYIDTVSGIQYIKKNGVWDPLVDYASFAPPPADPLTLNQLNVNTIRGNSSDSVVVDLGTTGDLNVSLAPGQIMDVGGGNATIQGNGNITSQSTVRAYDALIDNFAGRQLSVQTTPEYKIKVQGAPDIMVVESALDQDIEVRMLGTGKVSVKKDGAGQIDIDPQNSKISSNTSPFTVSAGILNVESTGGSLNLKAGGLTQVQDLLSGKVIVLDPTTGTIAGNPDAPFVIQNIQNNQDLDLKTIGAGQINLRSGSSNIVCHNPFVATTFGITTSSINASQTYTEAKALIANGAGALAWSKLPETAIFTAVNVGSNSNTYLNVSSLGVNPADVPVYPVLQPGTKIRRLEACLMSSVAWSWNGGDARIKLGYVQENLPCTDANFISVLEFPINTASPWYFTLAIPNVAVNAGTHKLACRLDASGTAATNTQAELIVKVTIAD